MWGSVTSVACRSRQDHRIIRDAREQPLVGVRLESDVGRKTMLAAKILDELDGSDLLLGRDIDNDIKIAVE